MYFGTLSPYIRVPTRPKDLENMKMLRFGFSNHKIEKLLGISKQNNCPEINHTNSLKRMSTNALFCPYRTKNKTNTWWSRHTTALHRPNAPHLVDTLRHHASGRKGPREGPASDDGKHSLSDWSWKALAFSIEGFWETGLLL